MNQVCIACVAGIAMMACAAHAGPTAPEWLLQRSSIGSPLSAPLQWEHNAARVQVADPIVFPHGLNSKWIEIPAAMATFQMVFGTPPYREPAAAILTFTDETPVCSAPAGIFGVDAGMGAFLTPQAQTSITAYLKTLPEGWSLYDGLIYDQSNGGRNKLSVFKLPDGVEIAGFSTGGDGGFEVDRLMNADGEMVALVVSIRDAEGLIPQKCSR